MDATDPNDGTDGEPQYCDARGWGLSDPRSLAGLELRYLLTDLMASTPGQIWTVAELVRTLEGDGFDIPGRASKTVSDHLRWEVGRGRVSRVGRSRYRVGSIPETTHRRIRRAARHRRVLLASVTGERAELAGPGGDRFT